MSDKVTEVLLDVMAHVLTIMVNALFILWFWNDGLVGAVDGVHEVSYWKALSIYMLVYCFLEPLFKTEWTKKSS